MALGLVVNGVVEACYNDATGILRVATPTKPCLTNTTISVLRETAISWNQVGPQGLKGDKGDKGETGEQGIQGPEGATGPQGPGGATNVQYVTVQADGLARAFCPPGTKVVGGGAFVATGSQIVGSSHPIANASGVTASGTTAVGWQAVASDGAGLVSVTVICAGP